MDRAGIVLENIKTRRSVRKFSDRRISDNDMGLIIEAGRWAPSGANAQPWRFIVITDMLHKRGLAEAMAEMWLKDLERDGVPQEMRTSLVEESIEHFVNAPVLVVACLTLEDMDKYPDEERRRCERDLAVQSLAAGIQNLLLAADAKGLGACWYCAPIFCKSAVRRALKVPDDVEPQALIAMGLPAETPSAPPRQPLGNVAFLGVWGKPL